MPTARSHRAASVTKGAGTAPVRRLGFPASRLDGRERSEGLDGWRRRPSGPARAIRAPRPARRPHTAAGRGARPARSGTPRVCGRHGLQRQFSSIGGTKGLPKPELVPEGRRSPASARQAVSEPGVVPPTAALRYLPTVPAALRAIFSAAPLRPPMGNCQTTETRPSAVPILPRVRDPPRFGPWWASHPPHDPRPERASRARARRKPAEGAGIGAEGGIAHAPALGSAKISGPITAHPPARRARCVLRQRFSLPRGRKLVPHASTAHFAAGGV